MFSIFTGVHRSEERHEAYVCHEVHEQSDVSQTVSHTQCVQRVGTPFQTGTPFPCQPLVRFSGNFAQLFVRYPYRLGLSSDEYHVFNSMINTWLYNAINCIIKKSIRNINEKITSV